MLMSIEGTPPSLAEMPKGCAFNPRCSFATEACQQMVPMLEEVGPNHRAACFQHDAVAQAGVSR